MDTDILVIGSGISGLSYTLHAAGANPEARITLLSKRDLLESNTRYAQGGIAVVSDLELDSFEKHVHDTLTAGDGLCDPEVVEFVVKEGPERLQELIDWGTTFDRVDDTLHLGREGGHSEHRIVHFKDRSGREIQESLIRRLRSLPQVTILENHLLVDLITDHHTGTRYGRCYGAYVIDIHDETILKISAPVTVLSTGGAGQVYAHTTNPEGATGDGIGAAYRAGVRIADLHFVQFHPTALQPKVDGSTFLISEAVRGAGARLVDGQGRAFMADCDPRGDLAPRDIVARAIGRERLRSEQADVRLDCREIDPDVFRSHFPTILSMCLKAGIDPLTEPVPVVPAAHYFCGGVEVDSHARTSLPGLLAIGECARTGLHGANRLASNSLLEALVFAHRAARATAPLLRPSDAPLSHYRSLPEWSGREDISSQRIRAIDELRSRLRATMSREAGIFKSDQSLSRAEQEIDRIHLETRTLYYESRLTPQLCELRNMISVSHMIVQQSKRMRRNVGVFYNQDLDAERAAASDAANAAADLQIMADLQTAAITQPAADLQPADSPNLKQNRL